MFPVARPALDGAPDERGFAVADGVGTDGFLEPEHEARANGLDDRRRAAFLTLLDGVEIPMLGRVDVGDGPPAGHARDAVAEELTPRDEDAWRPWPTDELVGRDEDRVLVRQRVGLAGRERTHLHRDIWRGGRVIPERQGPMAVEQDRDRPDVAQNAGHIRGGRERADLEGSIDMLDEGSLETGEVDPAVVILGDHNDVGQRFAPGQLVAVVLIRADEHDRALGRRDRRAEVVAIVEIGRQADLETVDEPVDGTGGPGAGEQDDVLGRGRADRLGDDPPGVFSEARGLETRARRLRVRVAVQRQDRLSDEILDEREGAAGCRVVGVCHAPQAERADDRLVVADHVGADRLDECRGRGRLLHYGAVWSAPGAAAFSRAATCRADRIRV